MSTFYDELDAKRNEKVAENLGQLLEKETRAKELHERSLKFRGMILGSDAATTPQEIVDKLLSF
jgi:fructose-bisphosphate aldolase class 1